MIWFTADNHFGHKGILKHCDRPFGGVVEMDKTLIANWNERVRPDDIVYHLADFCLGNGKAARSYLRRLNGDIYILGCRWHHDRRWLSAFDADQDDVFYRGDHTAIEAWRSLSGHAVKVGQPETVLQYDKAPQGHYKRNIHLSHYPLATWDRKHYGGWHLHGHSHGKHVAPGRLLDVGVDMWEFRPVSMDEVVEQLEGLDD